MFKKEYFLKTVFRIPNTDPYSEYGSGSTTLLYFRVLCCKAGVLSVCSIKTLNPWVKDPGIYDIYPLFSYLFRTCPSLWPS